MADYLRGLTNAELNAVADEMEERYEQFTSAVRTQINDEFRRRKMPPRVRNGQHG